MNYTARLKLQYPDLDDEGWNTPMEANFNQIDGTFLGSFAVTPAEVPSASLNYIVRGGTYLGSDGLLHTVADFAVQTMPASSTKYVYLKADGTLGVGSAFPTAGAGLFSPLAVVTAGTSTITGIVDARHPLRLQGS